MPTLSVKTHGANHADARARAVELATQYFGTDQGLLIQQEGALLETETAEGKGLVFAVDWDIVGPEPIEGEG